MSAPKKPAGRSQTARTRHSTDSSYVFCRDVLGYDLAAFFERNAAKIKTEVEAVLKAILTP